jgi:sporulation protein YlmC with PRC-barrel domain
MIREDKLQEKKLRGSGGYAIANVTDEEQRSGNLGGPELFLAGVGRLQEERFSKYYCNKCEKQYDGPPKISYENPNEQLGEGVTLIEKGEYKCGECDSAIAQYRKFGNDSTSSSSQTGSESSNQDSSDNLSTARNESTTIGAKHNRNNSPDIPTRSLISQGEFFPIQLLIGMPAYDSSAMLIGNVQEVGLRRSRSGNIKINVKISEVSNENPRNTNTNAIDVSWDDISKIGDIILVNTEAQPIQTNHGSGSSSSFIKCNSCGYQNNLGALYCEDCGSKI